MGKCNTNKLGISVNRFFISLLLGIIILYAMRCSGFTKNLVNVPVKVCSNKHVQKWGSTTCWLASRYFDATADACVFATTNPVYGAKKESWHAYKNTALALTMASFMLKGIEIGQNNTNPPESAKRFLFGTAPISYVIWQWQYHRVRYDKPFDYSPEHNPHRYMFPSFGGDKYTVVKPEYMVSIDAILFLGGIYHLFK